MAGAAGGGRPRSHHCFSHLQGETNRARVAGRSDTGLCSGCTAVRVNAGQFELDRLAYGGTAVQTGSLHEAAGDGEIAPGLFESARIDEKETRRGEGTPGSSAVGRQILERRPKQEK